MRKRSKHKPKGVRVDAVNWVLSGMRPMRLHSEAQNALFTTAQRGVNKGNLFRFTGPELTAMNLAMEIHDAQIDNCTIKELEQAMDIIHETVRNKKARATVTKRPA